MEQPPAALQASELYGEFYFGRFLDAQRQPYQRDEKWLAFFGGIADRIVQDLRPGRVLDVGCAMGFLVEALRERGVEAFGVDVSEYAVEHSAPEIRPHLWVGSATADLRGRYDLIVCIEVLEHLQTADSEQAVANLCAHADDILFASSPLDQGELTHFNCRPPEYWAQLFGASGFFRDTEYDPGAYIVPWAVRFRRSAEPPQRLAASFERLYWWLRNENHSLRESALGQRRELAEALARRDEAVANETTLKLALAGREAELEAMRSSRAWRLAEKLRGLRGAGLVRR